MVSAPEMPVAPASPEFINVTLRFTHSLKSMTPLPFPALSSTAVDWYTRFGIAPGVTWRFMPNEWIKPPLVPRAWNE